MTKKTLLLLGFVIAKFALQYVVVSPAYELQRDEFLHLDQAHHLAWGYISVPPVTSWIASLIYFLGNSLFWIRFFPALFGALTLILVWKAIEVLKGSTFALVLGATAVLLSALLRLNILFQPNSLDVLCWTGLGYILLRYARSENSKWLYYGMAVLAFGFLNKYNIVFWAIGLFPALILTKQKVFSDKNFYLAVLLFLLLIAPNLLWQYDNNFPVYHHMQLLAKTQLVHVNRWDFLKEQLYFFIGSLFVILAALYALLRYPPFARYRFFFWALCFTLAIFTFLKAKGYYAMGLYPIYIAFGAVYLETVLQSGWKKFLRPVTILIPIVFFIPLFNIMFPNKSPEYFLHHPEPFKKLGLLRWEDGKDHPLPQDYADMVGWKELARKVDSLYVLLPSQKPTLVLCDNYGQAGAINYYTTQNIAAVSFNADYIDWFELNKHYVNLIRVKTADSEGDEIKETGPFFESSHIGSSITNVFAREFGTTIFVFEKAKIDIKSRIQKEITEVKSYR